MGDFLATGRDGVLARETLDEMARVQTMVDQERWTLGWGLGLGLYRRGDRVYAGHGGAMPGFLAASASTGASAPARPSCVNTSAGADPTRSRLDLADAALEALDARAGALAPRRGAPADVEPLLGTLVVGGLGARRSLAGRRGSDVRASAPRGATSRGSRRRTTTAGGSSRAASSASCFASSATSRGVPTKLYLATYPLTRAAAAFADVVPRRP